MSAQGFEEIRVVRVERDDWEIVFGGPLLPESEMDVEASLGGYYKYVRASAEIGITREYGSFNVSASVKDGDHPKALFDGVDGAHEFCSLSAYAKYEGEHEDRRRAEGIHINHLWVDEEYRGEGIASYLFDIYRAVAVYIDGYAGGKVGGGAQTADWYVDQGVPPEDSRLTGGVWSSGEAAAFKTDAANLIDRGVSVKEYLP